MHVGVVLPAGGFPVSNHGDWLTKCHSTVVITPTRAGFNDYTTSLTWLVGTINSNFIQRGRKVPSTVISDVAERSPTTTNLANEIIEELEFLAWRLNRGEIWVTLFPIAKILQISNQISVLALNMSCLYLNWKQQEQCTVRWKIILSFITSQ